MAPRLIVIAALGITLTGCVSQGKYNALKLEKDQLVEQLAASETARSHAEAEAAAWKQQRQELLDQMGQNGNLVSRYMDENKSLREQYDQLMSAYNKLQGDVRTIGTSHVDPSTSGALQQLADENRDILEWDKDRGMLKFKSDVTFASGSAELTPQAKTVIARVAQILNTGRAANYELLVAGHTDNTRVVHKPTIDAGHKDNWYLSSHRAITVAGQMISHNVSPARLGALGYADQRPIASNGTTEGKARNRRVEVLLLPTTYRGGGQLAETPTTPARRTPPVVRPKVPELNKDTAGVDRTPVFSK